MNFEKTEDVFSTQKASVVWSTILTPSSYPLLEEIKTQDFSGLQRTVSKEHSSAYLFQLVHTFFYAANRCQCSQCLGIKAPETILATDLKESNHTSFLQGKSKAKKSGKAELNVSLIFN